MQKDFHYCLIKVLSQKSGFSADDAQVIAYASQYTDDAVEHQPIRIKNLPDIHLKRRIKGEHFDPICTAHRGIQYLTGLLKDVQKKVYIPFHFLPANQYEGEGDYEYCCVPNGNLPQFLLREAIEQVKKSSKKSRLQALIQLGVTLHTFADGWSHQSFSGRRNSRDNDIERIQLLQDGEYELLPIFDQLKLNIFPDVGHAEALTFPDQSHLHWKYEHDASALTYTRNNTDIFLDAAHTIFNVLCEVNDESVSWKSLINKITECLTLPSDSMKDKFQKYCTVFPEITFIYDENDWRNQALRGESFDWSNFEKEDYKSQTYKFNGDMKWFYFHIAAYKQRIFVLKNIKKNLL